MSTAAIRPGPLGRLTRLTSGRLILGLGLGGLLTLLIALALTTLAYQSRPSLRITVGNQVSDKGVIRDFYARERQEQTDRSFRWSRGQSVIALTGWGEGAYQLAIEMGAPLNPEPVATILVNGTSVGQTRLVGEFRPYQYVVPAEAITTPATAGVSAGDLLIAINSPTFAPPAGPGGARDARRLGVAVSSVTLEPVSQGWARPADAGLRAALSLAALAYLSLLVAGWRWPIALAGASGLVAGLAGLLAFDRVLVAPVLDELPRLSLLALAAVIAVRLALAGLARWPGWTLPRAESAWLLTILVGALWLRLVATSHPQINIIDIGFHVNRLTDVQAGNLFLRIRSAEWGGRETVYSPAVYLAMLPFTFLTDDKHQLVREFTAFLETSRLLLVFGLARWVSGSLRVARWAGLLFVSLPMGILVFSWGITSNLFGEWWATALLTLLAVAWRRLTRPAVALAASLVATLALLSHPGDLLLTAAWLGLLSLSAIAWLLWRRPPEPAWRRRALTLVAVVALAFGLSFVLFYRVDAAMMLSQGSATLQQRLSGAPTTPNQPARWRVSGSVDDKSLGIGARYVTDLRDVPLQGIIGYTREAWAYYWVWPLPLALLGWWTLRSAPRAQPFRWLSLAWAAAALLFALVGLLLNLYVRYWLFLLPVIVILAGIGLDRLASRWRVGPLLVNLLLASTLLAGLWFWHQRVVFFFN